MAEKRDKIIKLYKLGKSKLGISKEVGVTRAYVYEVLVQEQLFKTKGFQHIKRKSC